MPGSATVPLCRLRPYNLRYCLIQASKPLIKSSFFGGSSSLHRHTIGQVFREDTIVHRYLNTAYLIRTSQEWYISDQYVSSCCGNALRFRRPDSQCRDRSAVSWSLASYSVRTTFKAHL